MVIVVMGVSGSGKTTVGTLLASRLGWPYAEADDLHSPENIAKMASGQPLTDADRRPWLEAIAGWIDSRADAGGSGVVTCSALKRSYRDLLRGSLDASRPRPGRRGAQAGSLDASRPRPGRRGDSVRIVYLAGSRDLIARRLTGRRDHFMTAAMLDSQFADLEPPEPDEGVLCVPIDRSPADTVDAILAGLELLPNSGAELDGSTSA
jgi:gluconokinase